MNKTSNRQVNLLHFPQPHHLQDSSFIQAKIQRGGVGLIYFQFLVNVKQISGHCSHNLTWFGCTALFFLALCFPLELISTRTWGTDTAPALACPYWGDGVGIRARSLCYFQCYSKHVCRVLAPQVQDTPQGYPKLKSKNYF